MKPYPATSTQFDVDKYLDDHKDGPPITDHGNGVSSCMFTPKEIAGLMRTEDLRPQHGGSSPVNGKDFTRQYVPFSTADVCWCQPFDGPVHPGCPMHGSLFRGWATRLNDRIERRLDAVDWKRIDIYLGTLGGFLLTGTALYLIGKLLEAWLLGRFNVGAN